MHSKYQKIKLPTSVTFATKSGVLTTLEGNVHYQPGDALITGVEGERWPISRKQFELTYLPMSAVKMGENGTYIKKSIIVEAEQIFVPFEVFCHNKACTLKGNAGDWKITAPDGNQWIVAKSVFIQTYMQVI